MACFSIKKVCKCVISHELAVSLRAVEKGSVLHTSGADCWPNKSGWYYALITGGARYSLLGDWCPARLNTKVRRKKQTGQKSLRGNLIKMSVTVRILLRTGNKKPGKSSSTGPWQKSEMLQRIQRSG
jgi:hypothetical protein